MTHVSTSYVNCEKTYLLFFPFNMFHKFRGFIDEKIYDYPEDPDEVVAKIKQMSTDSILQNQENLIKPWPNTYTFTKNLCERSLKKHRGTVPLLILRPSIIIGSY